MEGGRFATFVSPVALSSSQTSHTTPVSTRGATTCVSPTEQPQLLLGHWDLSHTVRQAGPQLQQCSDRGHYPRDCPLTHPEPGETPWRWIKLHQQTSWGQQNFIVKPSHNKEKKNQGLTQVLSANYERDFQTAEASPAKIWQQELKSK